MKCTFIFTGNSAHETTGKELKTIYLVRNIQSFNWREEL